MVLPLVQLESLFSNLQAIKCDPTQVNAMVLAKLNSVAEHENNPAVQFRASSIGRPWVTQILDKWYGQSRSFTLESAAIMYEGRVAQAWAEVVLDLTPSLRYTTEGLVSHSVIQGHYDLCITVPGGKRVVLEVKSMGGHLVKDFRYNPHDDYGYLSQLSFYYHTLKADYAAFLVRDRTNAKFYVVEATPHALARKWERLVRVVEQVRHIPPYDVDALLDVVYETGIPYPTQGKIPTSVRYSKWADTLYHQDGAGYVIRPRDELAMILKQIPAARADGIQLALEFPE
jgi:hypothetical protein